MTVFWLSVYVVTVCTMSVCRFRYIPLTKNLSSLSTQVLHLMLLYNLTLSELLNLLIQVSGVTHIAYLISQLQLILKSQWISSTQVNTTLASCNTSYATKPRISQPLLLCSSLNHSITQWTAGQAMRPSSLPCILPSVQSEAQKSDSTDTDTDQKKQCNLQLLAFKIPRYVVLICFIWNSTRLFLAAKKQL